MSEKTKAKTEKVKVTLSVHQVVNYTQEVELSRDLVEEIEKIPYGIVDYDNNDHLIEAIKKVIDFKKIYSREEILECYILKKKEA